KQSPGALLHAYASRTQATASRTRGFRSTHCRDSTGIGDAMTKLLRRLHYWIHRHRLQAELEDEIEFHRALKKEELERSGVSAQDAAPAASRSMGNILLAREDARSVWIWPMVDRFSQDLRFTLRLFRKNPAF